MSILGAHQVLLPPAGREIGESELARIFHSLAQAPDPDPAMPKPGQSRLFSPKWRLPINSDEMISTRPGPPPVTSTQPTRAQGEAASTQQSPDPWKPVQYSTLRGLPHIFGARDTGPLMTPRFGQPSLRPALGDSEDSGNDTTSRPAPDRTSGVAAPKPVTQYARLPNTTVRHGPRTYPIRPLQPPAALPRPPPALREGSSPAPEPAPPLPPLPPIQPATMLLTTPGSIVSADTPVPYFPINTAQPTASAPIQGPAPVQTSVLDAASNVPAPSAVPSPRVTVTRIRPAQKVQPAEPSQQPLQAAKVIKAPEATFSPSLPPAVRSSPSPSPATARVAIPVPPSAPAIAPAIAPVILPPAASVQPSLQPSVLPDVQTNAPPPIWRRLPPTELPRPPVRKAPVQPPAPDEPAELEAPPPPIIAEDTRQRRLGRNIALATLLLGLPAGAALYYYMVGNPFRPSIAAVIDAPFVAVRAPVGGQLIDSRAVEGQSVMPNTKLFTIQAPASAVQTALPTAPITPAPLETPRYSPADARALLDGINLQIAAAETATLPRTATGQQIAARLAQLADLRRQRDAAERQLQLASATVSASNVAPPPAPVARPVVPAAPAATEVTAGVAGLLWSVLVTPGATVTSGATLAQVADCEKLFLAVPASDNGLRPGQTVDVTFGQQKPVRARVRQDAPTVGATARVTLDLAAAEIRNATGDRCPVGRTARVSPRS